MYLFRLDDASEYMDCKKWEQIENILNKYGIRPVVGIVPCISDPKLMYEYNNEFEKIIQRWKMNGWELALHGFSHELHKCVGGLNPVNNFSEFVGLKLEEQKRKIGGGTNA